MKDDSGDQKLPPSDPSGVVIPFGKHKGKTVSDLLSGDPQYADWLLAQGWLAERFADLHAAIMTRGAGTDDTPEHNALQARFLDDQFRTAFVLAASPCAVDHKRVSDYARNAASVVDVRLPPSRKITKYFEVRRICQTETDFNLWQYNPLRFEPQIIEFESSRHPERDNEFKEQLKRRLEDYTMETWTIKFLPGEGRNWLDWREEEARCIPRRRAYLEKIIVGKARLLTWVEAFERRGVDVIVVHDISHEPPPTLPLYSSYARSMNIELKPSLGDDFPTVIRQMQRLGSRYLLVGSYSGRAVPLPSLRQMFEVNGMVLVTVQEVEAEIPNARALIAGKQEDPA